MADSLSAEPEAARNAPPAEANGMSAVIRWAASQRAAQNRAAMGARWLTELTSIIERSAAEVALSAACWPIGEQRIREFSRSERDQYSAYRFPSVLPKYTTP